MRNRIVLISSLLLISITTYSQSETEQFSILFYNVENLFDIKDDPDKKDEEYLPGNERGWSYNRLKTKLLNISKVILSSNGWKPPGIVGLCEIENRNVLEMLTKRTPLKSLGYKIIHKESADIRGIDVAILYDPKQFYPLSFNHFSLTKRNSSMEMTRDLLYVSGIAANMDTIHVFVNHWPSRYSGVLETRWKRNKAAALLKKQIDVLRINYKHPKIIIMGDFNDQPKDMSLSDILKAERLDIDVKDNGLYNLSYNWSTQETGTLKYQSQWFVFDQLIVSGALLNSKNGFITDENSAEIITNSFLLEKDEKFGGIKPYRTYHGYSYNGGFSDHLPILLRMEKR